jgi:integrase
LKLPSKAKTTSSPSAITLVASAAAAQVPGERAQVELLARLDRGGYVDPTKVTLAAYLDRWLGHMASIGRDERTVERYGELLRLHVTPHLGGLRLQQLAPMHLSDLYAKLLREGRRDGRPGGLSARSVLHVHRALHRALRQAVRWRLLAVNPAADLELPPVAAAPMVTLTHGQARALLAAAQGWQYTLVLLGLATGARLGELLALRGPTSTSRWAPFASGDRYGWSAADSR